MDKNEKFDGPFISDIFRVIFGRKILLCVVTLVVAIALALGLKLGVSRNKAEFQTAFSYQPTTLNQGLYYDNSNFNYQTLISYANLENVKNSSEEFKDININEIVDGNISISLDTTDLVEKSIETKDNIYVLSIKSKYFSSSAQAIKFIRALVKEPITKNNEIAKNLKYQANLDAIKNSIYVEDQILLLENQVTVLETAYTKLIKSFGDVVLQGLNISNVSDGLVLLQNDSNLKSLETLLNNAKIYGYMDEFEKNKFSLSQDLDSVIYDYELNSQKIKSVKELIQNATLNSQYQDELTKMVSDNEDVKASIGTYINKFLAHGYSVSQVKELNSSITDIFTDEELNAKLVSVNKGNKVAYKEELNRVIDVLKQYTDTFNEIENKVIESSSNVIYTYASITKQVNGINNILILLISLLTGVVVGASINLIIDHDKIYQKQSTSENKQ
jgi:hypothetical protein